MSSLHKSVDKGFCQFLNMPDSYRPFCRNPDINDTRERSKIDKSFIKIVQPIIEEKVNIKFNCTLADSLFPSSITTAEQEINKTVTSSKRKIKEVILDDGKDVTNFFRLENLSISTFGTEWLDFMNQNMSVIHQKRFMDFIINFSVLPLLAGWLLEFRLNPICQKEKN